jgi:8-oxo-dGTP pyrophosphatase MutT (NUDIX family)
MTLEEASVEEDARLCGAGVLPYGKGKDGQLQLLLGRERFCRRGSSDPGALSSFSGRVNEPTETAAACAAREFVEETLAVVPLNARGYDTHANIPVLTEVTDVEQYLMTLEPRHVYRYTIPTRAGLGVHVHYLCPIPLLDYDVVFETVKTTFQRLRHLSCMHRQAIQSLSSALFGYTVGRRATHTVVDIEVVNVSPTDEEDPELSQVFWQRVYHVHPLDDAEHTTRALTCNTCTLFLRVDRLGAVGKDVDSAYYRLELTHADAHMLTNYVHAWRNFHGEAIALLNQHGLWNHPALLIQRAHTHILDLNLRPDFFEKTTLQWWPLQQLVSLASNPHQRHLRAFFRLILPALSPLLLQLAAWMPAVESDVFTRTSSNESASSSREAHSKLKGDEFQAPPDSCFQPTGEASGRF